MLFDRGSVPRRCPGRARGRRLMVAKSKSTSKKAATTASQVLRDKRYSDAAKTAAGSALSQKKTKKK